MSCACPRSPKGLSPAAHLADGSADLILVRKCSRFDFLRYLVRHTNQDDQVCIPFDTEFSRVNLLYMLVFLYDKKNIYEAVLGFFCVWVFCLCFRLVLGLFGFGFEVYTFWVIKS